MRREEPTTGRPPTDPQARALRFMSTRDSVTPWELARLMWPDSPAWGKATRRRDGRAGAVGGTMPMNAARLLRRLMDRGWVVREGEYGWAIARSGRASIPPDHPLPAADQEDTP